MQSMMPSVEEGYIFTTVRFDPALLLSVENTSISFGKPSPYYMLEHHWRRLQEAAGEQYPPVYALHENLVFLASLHKATREYVGTPELPTEPLRINFRVSMKGEIDIRVVPAKCIPPDAFFPSTLRQSLLPDEACYTVYVDDLPTDTSETTRHKTSDRIMYDRARQDAGIDSFRDPKEVLLFNKKGEIMDASITTPYFFRNGRWITPASMCGGQEGTTRRWALANSLCDGGVVLKSNLREGELVWMSNGLRGFFPGQVTLVRPDEEWKPLTPISRPPELTSPSVSPD